MEKKLFPDQIDSKRIFLKKLSIESVDIIFQMVDSDRKRLEEFLPWPPKVKNREEELEYIKLMNEKWLTHENFDYEIYLKENNSFIGMIGLHSLAWSHDRCEIGYWISKSYEGKGFVSESVIALEQKCFELGFNRLEIRCDPNNIKSGLLAEKCGYTLEGVLRENTVHLESYRSTKVFSKIRSDLK